LVIAVRYRNDVIGAHCGVLEHPGAARHVGDANALDPWLAHLESVGVTFCVTRLPELSITVFRDPDNIQIELPAAPVAPLQ
jgi:hypothetical protein